MDEALATAMSAVYVRLRAMGGLGMRLRVGALVGAVVMVLVTTSPVTAGDVDDISEGDAQAYIHATTTAAATALGDAYFIRGVDTRNAAVGAPFFEGMQRIRPWAAGQEISTDATTFFSVGINAVCRPDGSYERFDLTVSDVCNDSVVRHDFALLEILMFIDDLPLSDYGTVVNTPVTRDPNGWKAVQLPYETPVWRAHIAAVFFPGELEAALGGLGEYETRMDMYHDGVLLISVQGSFTLVP